MIRVHMAKTFPSGITVAKCWQTKPGTITTENPEAVDCKKCLKAMQFDREAEAEWQARKAQEGGAR